MSKALREITFARVHDSMFVMEDMKSSVLLCLPKLWLPTESWQELPLCQQDQIAVNKIDTDHEAHFSAPDFAHNRACCYQKARHNEDIFVQSYCTTLEDTVHSATNAPHCSTPQNDQSFQPWPLDLHGRFVEQPLPTVCSTCYTNSLKFYLVNKYLIFQALKKDWTGSWTLISTTMICIFVTTYSNRRKPLSVLSERFQRYQNGWIWKSPVKHCKTVFPREKRKWFVWQLPGSFHWFFTITERLPQTEVRWGTLLEMRNWK